MESHPSTGHLRSSTTAIAFLGAFEFSFELSLEFLPRLTGLFDRDRLLSFSDSEGSDALPGLKMAEQKMRKKKIEQFIRPFKNVNKIHLESTNRLNASIFWYLRIALISGQLVFRYPFRNCPDLLNPTSRPNCLSAWPQLFVRQPVFS